MLCGYQNQLCVPSGYQSKYLLPYPTGWENPKPRFWNFERWFSKVLEIFKNTLLYIIAGSFSSEGGGEGKVFISASGAMGEGCDLTVIPSLQMDAMLCGDQVLVCTPGRCGNRDGPTPVTDWHQSPAASPASPSPTPPKTPVTDWQIYWINILDLEMYMKSIVNKIFHHPYIIVCHLYITIKISNLHNDTW
jgi:hypothetical protein